MIIALIPARGGSKRLPRKNVKLLAGRPLIAYSILLGLYLPQIDRCIVSTEDAEIARIARFWGAEVIDRPADLASDHATTASVAQHALQYLDAAGCYAEIVVTLQPTCPLRPTTILEAALDLFRRYGPDSVVSVTENTHKIGRIVDGYFQPNYSPGVRSQDLVPAYFENGLIYVSQGDLVRGGELFGEHILPLITDPIYAASDIDTELDFRIVETILMTYRDHFPYAAIEVGR